MIEQNIAHIIIAPAETIETNLVKEAAGILQIDPYEMRLLLSGKIPKLFGHYQSTPEAELTAGRLKALGITAFICSDDELRPSPAGHFTAHEMKIGDSEIVFTNKTGQATKIAAKDAFLILKGKFILYSAKDTTTTKMKFSLSGTLMTGGFPVWRKVKETTKVTSTDTGYFVRLYDRIWVEPRVEILENNFDFSSRGTKITPSSFTNFNASITEIRNVFPGALYDERLTQPVGMSSSDGGQEVEMNCKLLYLYHRALSNPGRPL
jgi:hypothetical protein